MSDQRFKVVVHHGVHFQSDGLFEYIDGKTSNWSCDPNRWIYFEVLALLREIGYISVKRLWYVVEKLDILFDDNSVINMVNVAKCCGKLIN